MSSGASWLRSEGIAAARDSNFFMSSNPNEIQIRPQLALPGFEEMIAGARVRQVERRYSEAVIAWALERGRGNNTRAARLLSDPDTGVRCNPDTIRKRRKSSARLEKVAQAARESFIDNGQTLVEDVIEQPCIFCDTPLIRARQRFETCPSRPEGMTDYESLKGYYGSVVPYGVGDWQDVGHLAFVAHDPSERLNVTIGMLTRLGADRGWGQTARKYSIPLDVIADLTPAEALEAVKRIEAGESPETALLKRAG